MQCFLNFQSHISNRYDCSLFKVSNNANNLFPAFLFCYHISPVKSRYVRLTVRDDEFSEERSGMYTHLSPEV